MFISCIILNYRYSNIVIKSVADDFVSDIVANRPVRAAAAHAMSKSAEIARNEREASNMLKRERMSTRTPTRPTQASVTSTPMTTRSKSLGGPNREFNPQLSTPVMLPYKPATPSTTQTGPRDTPPSSAIPKRRMSTTIVNQKLPVTITALAPVLIEDNFGGISPCAFDELVSNDDIHSIRSSIAEPYTSASYTHLNNSTINSNLNTLSPFEQQPYRETIVKGGTRNVPLTRPKVPNAIGSSANHATGRESNGASVIGRTNLVASSKNLMTMPTGRSQTPRKMGGETPRKHDANLMMGGASSTKSPGGNSSVTPRRVVPRFNFGAASNSNRSFGSQQHTPVKRSRDDSVSTVNHTQQHHTQSSSNHADCLEIEIIPSDKKWTLARWSENHPLFKQLNSTEGVIKNPSTPPDFPEGENELSSLLSLCKSTYVHLGTLAKYHEGVMRYFMQHDGQITQRTSTTPLKQRGNGI